MVEATLTRDRIAEEALTILAGLRENARAQRSNKLADVKSAFEPRISIDFDTFFFFLRKYHLIGMDREACLQLTAEGEKAVDGDNRDLFLETVQEYFARQIDDPSASLQKNEPTPVPQRILPLPALELSAEGGGDPSTVVLPPSSMAIFARLPQPPERRPRAPRNDPEAARPTRDNDGTASAAPPAARPSPGEPIRLTDAKPQDLDLRYIKYEPIGQGSLGTVYRGRHTALGLDIAVKELKDIFGYFTFLQRTDVLKRLKREISAQAVICHPGILPVIDQNCDVARPYFVFPLCAGGNLRSKIDLAKGKGLAPDTAIRCFLQICYALRAAHAQGVIHGNLKPENVLFDSLENVKLADFGLNRIIEIDTAKGMPQLFVGTGGMVYMCAELITRSAKDIGPAVDVYGLGILLYEMLTGKVPGRRSPLPSAVNADVPAKVDALFDTMTQDRREDRYPDLDAVLDDFYAAFEGGPWLKKGDLVLRSDVVMPKTPPAESP